MLNACRGFCRLLCYAPFAPVMFFRICEVILVFVTAVALVESIALFCTCRVYNSDLVVVFVSCRRNVQCHCPFTYAAGPYLHTACCFCRFNCYFPLAPLVRHLIGIAVLVAVAAACAGMFCIALICAGRSDNGIFIGMSFCFDYPDVLSDLDFGVLIDIILTAGLAGPVFFVSCCGAGRFVGSSSGQFMTESFGYIGFGLSAGRTFSCLYSRFGTACCLSLFPVAELVTCCIGICILVHIAAA